jgi:DNA-binding transcriptional ArsR family regulator
MSSGADNLDAAFSALSDPTRRAILARLALGETTVMELAKPFEMSQPAISRHLRVLENAGLIVRRVEGAKHPCRLAEQGLKEVDRWLDILRTVLESNYDRLDKVLQEMQSENPQPPRRQRPVAGNPAKGEQTR